MVALHVTQCSDAPGTVGSHGVITRASRVSAAQDACLHSSSSLSSSLSSSPSSSSSAVLSHSRNAEDCGVWWTCILGMRVCVCGGGWLSVSVCVRGGRDRRGRHQTRESLGAECYLPKTQQQHSAVGHSVGWVLVLFRPHAPCAGRPFPPRAHAPSLLPML